MREATARRDDHPRGDRRRGRAADDWPEGGTASRLVDAMLDRPVRSGAVLVTLLATGVIVANAAFLQPGRHPAPLFGGSQPEKVERPAARPAPAAAQRAADDPTNTRLVRSERLPMPRPDHTETAAVDSALVARVQRGLAAAGLYQGPLDGIANARTRTAIETWQRQAGVAVDGRASEALATGLAAPQPVSGSQASAAASFADSAERQRIRAVQTALNAIGYGPVRVDGIPTSATQDAIRRFELDNGMPITGNADDGLVKKLVQIGAMRAN